MPDRKVRYALLFCHIAFCLLVAAIAFPAITKLPQFGAAQAAEGQVQPTITQETPWDPPHATFDVEWPEAVAALLGTAPEGTFQDDPVLRLNGQVIYNQHTRAGITIALSELGVFGATLVDIWAKPCHDEDNMTGTWVSIVTGNGYNGYHHSHHTIYERDPYSLTLEEQTILLFRAIRWGVVDTGTDYWSDYCVMHGMTSKAFSIKELTLNDQPNADPVLMAQVQGAFQEIQHDVLTAHEAVSVQVFASDTISGAGGWSVLRAKVTITGSKGTAFSYTPPRTYWPSSTSSQQAHSMLNRRVLWAAESAIRRYKELPQPH